MIRKFTLLFLLFLLSFTLVYAGQTGKIAGKVTDAETGEPLIGANVLITNTTMGAACDVDGDYFILNIPPGIYSVEVSMVGYTKVIQTEVRVSVDKTTTLNFELSITPIEGEEVVITAQRLAVKRDVSHSETVASSDEIEAIPLITDVTGFTELQAGTSVNQDGELLIRGGGGTQIGMVVDGLVVGNNLEGAILDVVNLSAIQEVSIIRGGFNAEYGNIRSGLFNVVTKEGSEQRYHGSIDTRLGLAHQKHRGANIYDLNNYYVRPYVDPAVAWVGTKNGDWDAYTQGQYREFEGWNAFTERINNDEDPSNDMTPEEARNLFIWQHALQGSAELGHPNPGEYGEKPDYNIDASLSGPVPFLGEYLTFFLSYRYNQTQYPFNQTIGAEIFNNFFAKINYQLNPAFRIGVEGIYNKTNTDDLAWGFEGHDRGVYFPHVTSPMDITQQIYGITVDHVLNPQTFYKFRASYINIKNDQNRARVFRNIETLAQFGAVLVDEQPFGWLNDPGYVYAVADEMVIGGVGGNQINQTEVNTLDIKFDLTGQVDKYNQVQGGFEFIYDDFNIFDQIDGFDPTGNNLNTWRNYPLRIQGYLQDKLEFQGFVANAGLRFDYGSPRGQFYGVDPYNRYFSRAYKEFFAAEAPSEESKTSFTVSPRLGVSHPITDQSKLYFNYGHFYTLAGAYDQFEINYGGPPTGIGSVGNPNLEPERTIAYELGYEQEFSDWFLFRLTGYYKDITNEIGEVNYVNFDNSVNYVTFENDQYQDVRGFEIELRRSWGEWITGWINYTYLVYNVGQVGREVQFQDPRRQAVEGLRNPIQEKPLAQPHANANFNIMSPAGWGPTIGDYPFLDLLSVNFLITWATGNYLTWDPLPPFTEENNLQWSDRWKVDMRISKTFDISTFEFDLFVDVVNVFDLRYLSGVTLVDEEGGAAVPGFDGEADWRDYLNSLHLPIYSDPKYDGKGFTAGDDQVGDVRSADKPYINMPNIDFIAWNPPRSVVLGLRIGF
ncbi:MAG: TonB-dependent receptor [Ignavibacteriaceae bacterium]